MARFDNATGRYIYLTIDGMEYRVYFEESGTGIPMLLQHTAGSDGRQWRHFLENADVAKNFRMIAYDLPYHAKSVPPTGKEWWKEEYKLTKDFLMKVVVTLSHELGLQKPVYMGSSIGGHLAGDLALYYPDEFRAVIGLEAGLGPKWTGMPSTPSSPSSRDVHRHPRIGNNARASQMAGLMSPTAPEALRRETMWVYSQGAPSVFPGDLYYYTEDHDLTETAGQIDTSKVAVYLLTGEYDSPERGEEMAEAIKGATFQKMEGLGHFPMSEDPDKFLEYMMPVLNEILSSSLVAH
jgi:pimeloyl-ACP methyl ester carboxylesterase